MNGFNLIIKPDEEDIDAAEVLVDGTIANSPYRFLLDTGAATSSIAFDDYTAAFECIETRQTSGVFATSHLEVIRIPKIELGPISKQNFQLHRVEAHHDIRTNLIGMDLLKDSCCHFLFDEERVLIQDEVETNLPFQELIVDKKFHPYVNLHFGAIKASAVWDTGAGITVADINFIHKHPTLFQEIGKSQGTDSTGAQMETPLFTMASPLIGNSIFSAHKVAGVDLSHVNSQIELPMDLILGYTTLRQANWLFDFPNKRWAISKRL